MNLPGEQMVWFAKTTALSQSIITFPMIGQISGYQAAVIFGLGLPTLFGVIQSTNNIGYAVVPFLCIVAFAMIRPPVMSYEARLLARLTFMLMGPRGIGGKKKKKKKTGKKKKESDVLCMPSMDFEADEVTDISEITAQRDDEPLEVLVRPNTQVEVSITLRTSLGILPKRKVCILFDDILQKTTISSSSGEVRLLLDSSDCAGRRNIVICDVDQDGAPGNALISKTVEFVQA